MSESECHCQRHSSRILLSLLVGVLLWLHPSSGSSQLLHIEGEARAEIVLASPDLIVFNTHVSGRDADELVAVDLQKHIVRWRQSVGRYQGEAVTDGKGAFFHISGGKLLKRDIATGKEIWQNHVDVIPDQLRKRALQPPFGWLPYDRTFTGSSTGSLGTPNAISYTKPIVAGGGILLFRSAMHGGGCDYSLRFQDWVIIDQKTGQLVEGGRGELLGRAGESYVITNEDYTSLGSGFSLWKFDGAEARSPQSVLFFKDHDPSLSPMHCTPQSQLSGVSMCAFEVNQKHSAMIGLCDGKTTNLTVFAAAERPGYHIHWLMLDKHLLRYSESRDYLKPDPQSMFSPWIELYDCKGKRIASLDLSPGTETEHWLVDYLGTNKSGNVVFAKGNQILIIAIPTLKRKATYDLDVSARDYHWLCVNRGSDLVYEVVGNKILQEMTAPELSHALQIQILDKGKKIWQFVEPVVIKKYKDR